MGGGGSQKNKGSQDGFFEDYRKVDHRGKEGERGGGGREIGEQERGGREGISFSKRLRLYCLCSALIPTVYLDMCSARFLLVVFPRVCCCCCFCSRQAHKQLAELGVVWETDGGISI